MSVNLPSPPIFILNDDILVYIFLINADMFSDKHALRTTRITSHVCQSWRNVMLATPLLWARLIDMDRISYPWSTKWRHELIRRSGDAPLWIKAHTFRPSMDILEFFEIVSKNWHRIQQLVMCGRYPSVNTPRLPLGIPAPHLATFTIALGHTTLAEVNEDSHTPLFGGYAPMLRTFRLNNYVVDKGAPWLCHLHSLTLDGGVYGICDVLSILAESHSLLELQITNISPVIGDSISSHPVVSPPHLKSLSYNGDPLPCIMLLDHIEIPWGCSLSIHIPPISEGLDFTAAQTLVTKFTRNARRFLRRNIFEIIDFNYLPDCVITFEGRATFPVKSTHNLSIPLYGSDASEQLEMLVRQLALLDLSRTTTLHLFTDKYTLDPSFAQFFSSLTSLDTIFLHSTSLESLMVLQNYIDATNQPHVIFPVLTVINFIIVTLDDDGCDTSDQIAIAAKFILSRIENGHPISRLDMGDTLPFNAHPDLDVLEDVKDLEVLYSTCSQKEKNDEFTWSDCNPEEYIDSF